MKCSLEENLRLNIVSGPAETIKKESVPETSGRALSAGKVLPTTRH